MTRHTQIPLPIRRSADSRPQLRPRSRVATLLALLAGLHALPALAVNRFVNADFDIDTAGWFANSTSGFAGWDSEDRYGCEGSGSAILTARPPLPFSAQIAGCIPVVEGEMLRVGFTAKTLFAPSAVQGHVRVELSVAFCDVPSWSHSSANLTVPLASWTRIVEDVPIPPGYATAWVLFELWSPSEFDVLFDDAYGGDPARLFSDGFEYGSTCRW
jgi:hypothetical protein